MTDTNCADDVEERRASPAIVQAAKTNGIASASEKPSTNASTSSASGSASSLAAAQVGRELRVEVVLDRRLSGDERARRRARDEARPCTPSRAAGRGSSRRRRRRRRRRSGTSRGGRREARARRARSARAAAPARRGRASDATRKTTVNVPSGRSPKPAASADSARADAVPGTANEFDELRRKLEREDDAAREHREPEREHRPRGTAGRSSVHRSEPGEGERVATPPGPRPALRLIREVEEHHFASRGRPPPVEGPSPLPRRRLAYLTTSIARRIAGSW